MTTTINAHPNPFLTAIRVEVTTEQAQHNIIRLFDEAGKFIRIFSWSLQRGVNIAMMNDLQLQSNAVYYLDIIDHNAQVLHKTQVRK